MSFPIASQLSVAQQMRIDDRLTQGLQPPPSLQLVANGFPQGDGSFASQVSGTRPQPDLDLQLAMMANDVYAADNPQTEQALQDAGWSRLEPSADGNSLVDAQGNLIPIDPKLLSTSEGFDAAIYQNDQGQYVVAFRGTDDWGLAPSGDADDNALQGLGFETGQYRDAVALAETAQRVLGEGNVAYTGHSLGGGLASAAALATGGPGVTFNAAGLSDQTLESLDFNPNAVREHAADSGQLRRYIVNGDPLNAAQQDVPMIPLLNMSPPDAIGHELRIDPPAGMGGLGDLVALHGGGGDGASYVDALRQNTAYDPSTRPTLPEQAGGAINTGLDRLGDFAGLVLAAGGRPALGETVDGLLDAGGDVIDTGVSVLGNVGIDGLERVGEFNLNQLGSVLRQGGEVVDSIRGNGSEMLSGLSDAGQEYLQGDYVDGTAQALGDVLDFGLDTAGSLADGALGLVGDTTQNLANAGGGLLRDIGDATGLEAPLDAVAGVVEGAGQVVSDAADTVGEAVETVADTIGDGVEKVVDVAGDVGQAVSDGATWLGEKLNPVNWF
ncbi:MAG TPA: Mbeg1-like protein [Luteimonas sp.]